MTTIYLQAALNWHTFGLNVIPVSPGTKKTAVKWDPWLAELSEQTIKDHWTLHPNHELGFIVGDDIIVFDGDSTESIAAIAEIEKAFELTPLMVVKTKKGEHHCYRRAPGTFAKSDAHDTAKYPGRIDVKTGRALVVLPPSTDKEIEILEAEQVSELSEVIQDVIDAVSRHNGRECPRPTIPENNLPTTKTQELSEINSLLDRIDPDCGYEDWLHVLMAVFHETKGSDSGLALINNWSSSGKKYKGKAEIVNKWASFKQNVGHPITMGTLIRMANQKDYVREAEEKSDPIDTKKPNALDKYALNDRIDDIEQQMVESKPLLGLLALKGQATAFYAAPNIGKTLIILYLLIDAIQDNRINPSQVYYLNMDDTAEGLLQKLRIASEYGFQMLAEGYAGFSAQEFSRVIKDMIDNNRASGVVIILDTLKKFVDLMNKSEASRFNNLVRQFTVKGGTVIGLAHTNKNPGQDGKPKFAGTSDVVDDWDCSYTIAPVSNDSGIKVVEFENIKRRGNVVEQIAYQYNSTSNQSYESLIQTVGIVDELNLIALRQQEKLRSDAELIEVVKDCIQQGINSKMKLAREVANQAQVSRQKAIDLIEAYTGPDPEKHQWHFKKGERGVHQFEVLLPKD